VVGEGLAMYHTAGSLCEGSKVWLLAKLPNDIKVKGNDIVEKFLLLSTTHDGTGTLKMFFTPVRVVCNNTLTMALQGRNDGFSLRHTASVEGKLVQAREALGFAVQTYNKIELKLNWLADQKFTDLQMDQLVKTLCPSDSETDLATKTVNNRETIKTLFANGIGIDASNRGTAWAAFNAVTEYADHHKTVRGNDPSNRLNSIWFGSSSAIKVKAIQTIDQLLAA